MNRDEGLALKLLFQIIEASGTPVGFDVDELIAERHLSDLVADPDMWDSKHLSFTELGKHLILELTRQYHAKHENGQPALYKAAAKERNLIDVQLDELRDLKIVRTVTQLMEQRKDVIIPSLLNSTGRTGLNTAKLLGIPPSSVQKALTRSRRASWREKYEDAT